MAHVCLVLFVSVVLAQQHASLDDWSRTDMSAQLHVNIAFDRLFLNQLSEPDGEAEVVIKVTPTMALRINGFWFFFFRFFFLLVFCRSFSCTQMQKVVLAIPHRDTAFSASLYNGVHLVEFPLDFCFRGLWRTTGHGEIYFEMLSTAVQLPEFTGYAGTALRALRAGAF